MQSAMHHYLSRIGTLCRGAAATLIARLWPGHTVRDVDRRLAACPARQQAMVTGGVMLVLLLLSLFVAQFGWIGILLFWLGVILVAR
jgi:hypothetical protein